VESTIFKRIEAIHPHWRGSLKLFNMNSSVVHEDHGSKGTYELSNKILTVYWDKYGSDVFFEFSGIYIHRDLLDKTPGIDHINLVKLANDQPAIATRLSILIPGSNYEISLRLRTSDVPTFEQIFVNFEYESPNLPDFANAIVDLGANIGLATVFFALKYPETKILSIEPEENNFAAMLENTAALGARVQKQNAAVWVKDGFINLHTENENSLSFNAWGVQVSENTNESNKITKCYKLGTILDNSGFNSVDILKIVSLSG
jgi:FkbM family methyltransferase